MIWDASSTPPKIKRHVTTRINTFFFGHLRIPYKMGHYHLQVGTHNSDYGEKNSYIYPGSAIRTLGNMGKSGPLKIDRYFLSYFLGKFLR